MFFSWIYRDKLDYIKDELIYLWSLEAKNNNYTNKYGDLLWFAYLIATKHQRYILKNTVFDSWDVDNKYRNGTIHFSENIFRYSKNINCNCNKIEKGTILLWCNKYTNKKEPTYPPSKIAQQDIPLIDTKEPKTKYKLKSTYNNGIAKQNEILPALTANDPNNKKPIYNIPIQEKTFTNQRTSKPQAKKFKFKTGQQSLISKNLNSPDAKDLENNDLSAVAVQDLTSIPKSIPNPYSQAPNAVELKKNKITFIPNSKKKNQEVEPEETIFLVEKKLNKYDKHSLTGEPIADLKNEEVNEQINQDSKGLKLPNEVTKKPNKIPAYNRKYFHCIGCRKKINHTILLNIIKNAIKNIIKYLLQQILVNIIRKRESKWQLKIIH